MNGIQVIPVPGVSAITSAISISGFSDQFLFYGFLPKTKNELDKVLQSISDLSFSIIFFIPSIKINFYLNSFKTFFVGRKILIAREITKLHEAFYREDVDKIKVFESPIKGELTVVLSEKNIKKETYINEKKIKEMAKIYLEKYSLKDTVELISKTEKVQKKKIYKICLLIKDNE